MTSLPQILNVRHFIRSTSAIRWLAFVFCFAALVNGCSSHLLKSLRETAALRGQLIDEFHEQNISVMVYNTTILRVAFINSPLNNSDQTERANRAQQVAVFVRNHYRAINQIEQLWVSFVIEETRFAIFHYYKGVDSFGFNKNGDSLAFGPRDRSYVRESNDPRHAQVRYSRATDETDIQVTRVQLAGNLDRGLALVPHFTVRGNALAPDRKRTLPRSVGLEFASYSDRKLYGENTPLTIAGDGQTIFSGSARLLSTATDHGTTTEFLSAQISYSQFLEMTMAGQVEIKLATKTYRLSNDQLEGLRDMARYAEGAGTAPE